MTSTQSAGADGAYRRDPQALRHDTVALLPDGWVACARCGASWDAYDDERRGMPRVCEPEPLTLPAVVR